MQINALRRGFVVYWPYMQTFSPDVREALIQSQDAFVWEAPNFERRFRGPQWYFIMTIVAVFLIAYAVWTANFLFAFIILLSAILLLLVGNQDPRSVLVQIGENGVVYNGRLYLYQDIQNFSIAYEPPLAKVLYLELRSTLAPRLTIQLEDEDPLPLRAFLREYVAEDLDLQGEHFSDMMARLLKL